MFKAVDGGINIVMQKKFHHMLYKYSKKDIYLSHLALFIRNIHICYIFKIYFFHFFSFDSKSFYGGYDFVIKTLHCKRIYRFRLYIFHFIEIFFTIDSDSDVCELINVWIALNILICHYVQGTIAKFEF